MNCITLASGESGSSASMRSACATTRNSPSRRVLMSAPTALSSSGATRTIGGGIQQAPVLSTVVSRTSCSISACSCDWTRAGFMTSASALKRPLMKYRSLASSTMAEL